ncbi:hypothetical protein ABH931_000486 [Streptacidiphilus sp. MAP12-33]
MGTTTRYRFREYSVRTVADPCSLPALSAVCVTGEEADCGASSGEVHSAEELVRWIAEHCAQTQHELFERQERATVRAEAGVWL